MFKRFIFSQLIRTDLKMELMRYNKQKAISELYMCKRNRGMAFVILCYLLATTSIYYSLAYPSGHRYEKCICISGGFRSFFSIQEAINQAANGDVIYVPPGIYYENIVINKSVSLKGKSSENTIIDGCGLTSVIHVIANDLEISGFTIRNGLYGIYVESCLFVNITSNMVENSKYGVYLDKVKFNRICRNNITSCNVPIVLQNAQHNHIEENFLFCNYGQAVSLYHSNGNLILRNNIEHNPAFGVYLESCENNTVWWNNIAMCVKESAWNFLIIY